MPELPDLEVFKTNIYPRLTSKRLVGLEVFNAMKVHASRGVQPQAFIGRDLAGIDRFGKELFFDFGEGKTISAHLMLNGEISLVVQEAADAIRHKIFALRFEEETLVFSDRGGLCTIRFAPPLSRTPDAFGASFTWEYFLKTARAKPLTNVKAFLIDQKVVKGIGNAYADEILWAARISPRSFVGKIPEEKLMELYRAIDAVLRGAVDSIRRIAPDIISGEERSFLKVHNKKLRETETGYPIIIETVASKITYYTGEQVLYS